MSSEVISESAGPGGRIEVPEFAVRFGDVNPGARKSVEERVVTGHSTKQLKR